MELQIPLCDREILGDRTCLGIIHPGMPDDSMSSAMQKHSRCHLDYGLGRAVGSMCYTGAHWCNLANTTEPSVYGGDATLLLLLLNDTYVGAYV